jgi:hypothetical protein
VPQTFDERIVKLTVEANGKLKTYEGLAIKATGTKYTNALQNDCTVTISNLDKATQDYILTQTSPYARVRTPKSIILEAGRQSYGTTKIYTGNIVSSVVSQPPDIGVTLKCLTGNFLKGNIISRAFPNGASFSQIAAQIAQDTNTLLKYQASNDPKVNNYGYSGAAIKQIGNLAGMSGLNVFVNDGILVVKDAYVALTNTVRILDAQSGMIGIPEFTEQGMRVKFFIDNKTTLGGTLRIISKVYPAASGDYVIYKLNFDIANRENPFYYIAEAARHR